MAETLGMAFLGDKGAMKPAPKMLISQSLPKVLESATPAVMAEMEGLLYPGMLAIGVLAYGLDIWRAMSEEATQRQAAEARERAQAAAQAAMPSPMPGSNGNGAHPEAVELVQVSGAEVGGVDDLASHDGRDFINPRPAL